MSMLKLEFADGSRSVWLVGPSMKLGSAKNCDLVIVDEGIADVHCLLRITNDQVTVEPLDNNPCSVNDKLISTSIDLNLGDHLSLGQTSLVVVKPKQASSIPQPKAATPVVNELQASGWMLQGLHNSIQKKRFPIDSKMVLGRSKDCDLHFSFERLSRRHAELKVIDGYLVVEDLDSSNGTFHNGKRIKRATLTPGDEVAFDTLNFAVVGEKDQSSDSMAWDNSLNQTVVRSAITPKMIEKTKESHIQTISPSPAAKVDSSDMIQPRKSSTVGSNIIIGSLTILALGLLTLAFIV